MNIHRSFDIYNFFNSSDVANHCKSIDYKFQPLELAVLIYWSNHRTLNEKIEAFKQIIESFPNTLVPCENHTKTQSLAKLLEQYIEITELIQDRFLLDEPNTYFNINNSNYSFSNYDQAKAQAMKFNEQTSFNIGNDSNHYILTKHFINHRESIVVEFNGEHESIRYRVNGWDDLSMKEFFPNVMKREHIRYDISSFLEDFIIRIPIPFKRGDLLYLPKSKSIFSSCDNQEDEILVYDSSVSDLLSKHDNKTTFKYNNCEDMGIYGYTLQGNDDKLHLTYLTFDFNLSYYRGTLDEKELDLHFLSKYIKGEMEAAVYTNLCNHYRNKRLAERYVREAERFLGFNEELYLDSDYGGDKYSIETGYGVFYPEFEEMEYELYETMRDYYPDLEDDSFVNDTYIKTHLPELNDE